MNHAAEDLIINSAAAAAACGGSWYGPPPPPEFSGAFTDTRSSRPGACFFAFRGEKFDAHDHLEQAAKGGAAILCIERSAIAKAPAGIPLLAVENTITAYQQIASLCRNSCRGLLLAGVTGSVGKTSVKEILRAIFCAAAGNGDLVLATSDNTNNQIGVPQNLFRLNSRHRFAVIEMGSNHFGEIAPLSRCARPQCAIVNSIAPCHLEFFIDLDGVAREKSHIFDGVPEDGTAVIPYESAGNGILRRAAGRRRILTFGTDPRADFCAGYLGGSTAESSFSLRFPDGVSITLRWHLTGLHQALNAAAAAAAAHAFGISREVIAEGIPAARLPGMRTRITSFGGATFINDAYNANPVSMRSTLTALAESGTDPGRVILILGGMRELGASSGKEHLEVRRFARELFPAATIVLIGDEFTDPGGEIRFARAEDARQFIRDAVKPGYTFFIKGSLGTATWKALPEEVLE